jgi:uncharacterized protein with HEPN domain
MPRDYKVYLEDILEAIHKIRSCTEGYSYETFVEDFQDHRRGGQKP